MAKKKLTQQQLKRIKANQDAHGNENTAGHHDNLIALVITRFSNQAIIEDDKQQRYKASIRRHLTHLTAGDRVLYKTDEMGNTVILSSLERDSVLGRYDKQGNIKPVAANVTQMFITFAAKPEPSTLLIDSYLLAAESFNIKPVLLYNKADIVPIAEALAYYHDIGYELIETSAVTQKNISTLKERIKNNLSVFVGQSGVGKSTLISSLLPDIELRQQQISEQSELGKHTTSNSTLYHLDDGGDLIDSPGIREFTLSTMPKELLLKGFIDFQPYLGTCKFKNCTHTKEKSCAIIDAVSNGTIPAFRQENYTALFNKYSS